MNVDAKISVIQSDIVVIEADAIVNAANTTLLGGGGVDGAIHRAAGPRLLEACRKLKGCKVGEAKATPAFRLPAKWVIHTVGPIWQGGADGEPQLLANCYRNSLQLALKLQARTVAFPAISTGVYRYPLDKAAWVAVGVIKSFLKEHPEIEQVWLVCFTEKDAEVFQTALDL